MWLSTIKFCHFNFIVDLVFVVVLCLVAFFLLLFLSSHSVCGVVAAAAKLSRSRCHFSYGFLFSHVLCVCVFVGFSRFWNAFEKLYFIFVIFFLVVWIFIHAIEFSISLLYYIYQFLVWSFSLCLAGVILKHFFFLVSSARENKTTTTKKKNHNTTMLHASRCIRSMSILVGCFLCLTAVYNQKFAWNIPNWHGNCDELYSLDGERE